jgi:hypothetical protein
MAGKEKLEVVEIEIPKPYRLESYPPAGGIPFGKHLVTIVDREITSPEDICGGGLLLEIGSYLHTPEGKADRQCQIRCNQCGLVFSIGSPYQQAVWEWMRIVLGAAILQLTPLASVQKYSEYWTSQPPTICLPRTHRQGQSLFEYLRKLYPNWWGEDHPNEGKLLTDWPWTAKDLPMWGDHGIIVAQIARLDTIEGLHTIIFIALYLMDNLEKSFQDAIQKSARLASSTSEVFHPATRRRPRN